MANLKTLKVRIKSIKATQKITKAMQMVAAAKLRRARMRLEASLPYFAHLEAMINNVLDSIDYNELSTGLQKLLINNEHNSKYLVIVTSSDRGLCGSFNVNIQKAAKRFINNQEAIGKKCDILTIGNKVYDALKTIYKHKIVKSFPDITKKPVDFEVSGAIQKFILEAVNNNIYDHVVIVYSHFKSVISQEIIVKQLVPVVEFQDQAVSQSKVNNY